MKCIYLFVVFVTESEFVLKKEEISAVVMEIKQSSKLDVIISYLYLFLE